MSVKTIQKHLEQALLEDSAMNFDLYADELKDIENELKESMAEDNDDFIFSVTERDGDVAMVLIESSGNLYVNDDARYRLKTLWLLSYRNNIEAMIPDFADQLNNGEIPINGVKVVA